MGQWPRFKVLTPPAGCLLFTNGSDRLRPRDIVGPMTRSQSRRRLAISGGLPDKAREPSSVLEVHLGQNPSTSSLCSAGWDSGLPPLRIRQRPPVAERGGTLTGTERC
jgi:hypothetical protein